LSKIAFLYPGQGSQFVGMGRAFFEMSSLAQDYFEEANEALGFSLSSLCFEGPMETLTLTEHTQPALLTHSVIGSVMLVHEGVQPNFIAGHSLGEISAATAFHAFSFSDGVRFVRNRGKYMQEAVPPGQGAMAAVISKDLNLVTTVCDQVTEHIVTIANINSPEQIVISGDTEGVKLARELLKAEGVRRVIPLPVSAPFHSPLMHPAAERLANDLEQMQINNLQIPLINNADVQAITSSQELGAALIKQVDHPVRWREIIDYLFDQGVDTFIEIGAGNVLTGLMRRIARGRAFNAFSVQDPDSFDKTINKLKELS